MKKFRLLNILFHLYLVGSVVFLAYAVFAFGSTGMIEKEMRFIELQGRRGEIGKMEQVAETIRLERALVQMRIAEFVSWIALGTFCWQAMGSRKWPITRRGMRLGWVGAACIAPLPLAIPLLILWSMPGVRSVLEVGGVEPVQA